MPRDLFAEQPKDLFAPPEGYTSSAMDYALEAPRFLRDLAAGVPIGLASVPGLFQSPESRQKTRESITDFFGARPDELGVKTGEYLTEGALTALPGNALASAATRFGAPAIANALRTAGFGEKLPFYQRIVGGAVPGAAGGALGSPDAPISGAAAGAAMGGAMGYASPLLTTPVKWVSQRLTTAGRQNIIDQVYRKAFGNDTQRMQQALQMAEQGASAQEIAVATNNPVFAGLISDLEGANADVLQLAANKLLGAKTDMANRLAAAEAFTAPAMSAAEQRVATGGGQLLPDSQAAIGGGIREAASKNIRGLKTAASAEYDKAIELAGSKADDVSSLVSAFQKIEDLPLLEWRKKPGELGDALRRFVSKDAPGSDPLLRAMTGAADDAPAAIPPTATLETIDGLRRAISSRQSKLFGASTPEAVAERAALGKMKDAVDDFIAKSNFPSEAKAQYVFANQNFADTVVPAAKTGLQPKIMSRWTDNQTQIVNEDIIPRMFAQGGEAETKNLLNMIGPSREGKDAVSRGVLETFRKTVAPQGERGAFNVGAANKFLDDYRFQLDQLEAAGIRVRGVMDAAISAAQTAAKDFEKLSAQSKALASLKSKVNADPKNVTAVRDYDAAQSAVSDVTRILSDRSKFLELAAMGGTAKIRKELADYEKGTISKLPVGITAEIIYNNVSKFLSDRVSKKVADQIGRELLDSGLLKRALQSAAAPPKSPRIPAGLLPAVTIGGAAAYE